MNSEKKSQINIPIVGNKLISVIVPVYNSENFIGMCIESVLNQSYKQLELILVVDGATDNSGLICQQYANKDSRIRVFFQENAGVSEAKNTGLEKAKGDYIKLMDHDDVLHPQTLEICIELAERTGADIVQHSWCYMRSDVKEVKFETINELEKWELSISEAILQIEPHTCRKELGPESTLASVVLWSKLFKRNIWNGIKFDKTIMIHEDQMMVHRLLAKANKGIVYTNAQCYYFRETPLSLSRRPRKWERLEIIRCYYDRLLCVRNLSKDIQKEKNLIYETYRRYLICIIQNYRMINKELSKEQEFKEKQQELKKIFRKHRKQYKEQEKWMDKLIFCIFEKASWVFKIY